MNILDVIIDLRITVELIEPTLTQSIISDLNRDRVVDVFDAIISLKHIVGLLPTLDECGPPPPPDISVSPLSLEQTQGPNRLATQGMGITNTGAGVLTWTLRENPEVHWL